MTNFCGPLSGPGPGVVAPATPCRRSCSTVFYMLLRRFIVLKLPKLSGSGERLEKGGFYRYMDSANPEFQDGKVDIGGATGAIGATLKPLYDINQQHRAIHLLYSDQPPKIEGNIGIIGNLGTIRKMFSLLLIIVNFFYLLLPNNTCLSDLALLFILQYLLQMH